MIPDECKMRDLSHLGRLNSTLLLRVVFTSADTKVGYKSALYRRIFARLIDKAISEYEQARFALVSQVEERKRTVEEMQRTGRIIYMFAFSNHMENCINAVRRLLRLLERINSDPDAPQLPRDTRRWLSSQSKKLVDVRDTIEHMDERIQGDGLGEREPIMLKLGGTGDLVEIGSYQINFSTLTGIIEKLHGLGSYLVAATD